MRKLLASDARYPELGLPRSLDMARPYRSELQIGVKGALFRRGRLLILRRAEQLNRDPGGWDLPGGGVKGPREELREALRREVREETGYSVRVLEPFHVWRGPQRLRDGTRYTGILVFYRCAGDLTGTPALDPEEHSEFCWALPREAEEISFASCLKEAVRLAVTAK